MSTLHRNLLAAVIVLGAGCRTEDRPMRMAAAGAPPIDREAPATLETATFALG